MAVYTEVTDDELDALSSRATISARCSSFKGIAEGVENSNFLLHTDEGPLHPDALREAGGDGATCRSSSA